MAYNRRSGFGGGNSGSYGNSFGQNGGNFGGGGNFNGGGGRFNNFNNYGRNTKMSPWESGVSPGGGMMPNVHPNQMALASDLLSKLLAPNQVNYLSYSKTNYNDRTILNLLKVLFYTCLLKE